MAGKLQQRDGGGLYLARIDEVRGVWPGCGSEGALHTGPRIWRTSRSGNNWLSQGAD